MTKFPDFAVLPASSVAFHPVCSVVRLRAARRTLWMRHVWDQIPEAPHYAAIQHEEVDRILSDPEQAYVREATFYRENEDAAKLRHEIQVAEEALAFDPRWQRTIEGLQLTKIEANLFAVASALALDPSLGRVCAYLHDQPEMTHTTVWLASALFETIGSSGIATGSPLLYWHLLRRAPDAGLFPETWGGWLANASAMAWLLSQGDDDLPHGARLVPAGQYKDLPALYPDEAVALEHFYTLALARSPATIEFELLGPDGSGRSTLAGQFAAAKEKSLLYVDSAVLTTGANDIEVAERVVAAIRAATLRDAILLWDEGSDPHPLAKKIPMDYPGLRIVARTMAQTSPIPADVLFRSLELPSLTRSKRELLWESLTRAAAPRQIRDWMLTPAEICAIAQVGDIGDEAVVQACRRPTESQNLLLRLPLPYKHDELILGASVQDQLDEFETQIRLRWDVYEDWGFERLCPNGRGIVALFAGPTGTGKTMAAQVLASKLGLELYRLDPAQVVNKYIGETEKRLKTIFDECDRAHFLLLIDECEGMFGQRFNSKDAHDRYANLEIDYLLQRLERFQGVAVLATNRKSDLDSAFLRRIRFVIDFLHPGPAERRKLWMNAIPEKRPSGAHLRDGIDWDLLSEKVSLTGAEIKLAALNSAFLAYAQKQKIGMPHLLTAIRREFAKKGQTLRGFE